MKELETLAELKSFAESIEQERQKFLGGLNEDVLHARLQFSDMAGTPYSEPLVQLMQHLVNHGTYHRGQVTTMLRQIGGEAASLDMLYFFREAGRKRRERRSRPRWPAARPSLVTSDPGLDAHGAHCAAATRLFLLGFLHVSTIRPGNACC